MINDGNEKTSFIKDLLGMFFIIAGRLLTIPFVLISLIILTFLYKITKKESLDNLIDKLFVWAFSPPFIMAGSLAFWVVTILNFINLR